MFDGVYWLCNQCLSDYEVSFSNFCITWNQECSVRVRVAKKNRSAHDTTMAEVHKGGALDLSIRFEELAPSIGLSSCNKIQCVRDSQIGDLSLGLASLQDPKGPLRKKEDDLVADTILEKASDWTSTRPLLMALLRRLMQEISLPFANQVVMAALKNHAPFPYHDNDKYLAWLEKNELADITFLFKLLVFWSRNIWKRSSLSDDNCSRIRHVICSVIRLDEKAKKHILKVCTQNLMCIALLQGSLGLDQATCSLSEDIIAKLCEMEKNGNATNQETTKSTDDDVDKVVSNDEVKLYDALACVVLSTKNSKQPWAMEMLVKVLRKVVVASTTSSIFTSICHADLKNVLPEMAQLQWLLHGNAGIKMISSCPSCQYLAVITYSGSVYVVNQDGFVTPMPHTQTELKGLVWSSLQDDVQGIDLIGFSDSTVFIWDPVCGGDAQELTFHLGSGNSITSMCVNDISSTFVMGTSSGQAFTPDTSTEPVQLMQEDIMLITSLQKSNQILMLSLIHI